MTTKTSIIQRAQADYNPSIVAINDALVKKTLIPKDELGLLPSEFHNSREWLDRPVEAIAFFVALNSINYRFWDLQDDNGKCTLARYDFLGTVGSAGMRRAFDILWSNAPYLSVLRRKINAVGGAVTADFVRAYFGDMPDVDGRVANLNDIFQEEKLESVAAELLSRITKNGKLTVEDAHLLHATFPIAYHDAYYKRSQLAMAMIAGFFFEKAVTATENSAAHLVNIAQLTGFADYQIPRIGRGMGLLTYSKDIATKVDNLVPIQADSLEERAIRSATILLLEKMAEANGVTPGHVDSYLFSQRTKAGSSNFHLTVTEDY